MSEQTEALGEIPENNSDENLTDEAAVGELAKVIKTLPPREQDIIALRFGLLDGKVHTLAKIGEKYGITRERVRQLEARALAKIRASMDSPSAPDSADSASQES